MLIFIKVSKTVTCTSVKFEFSYLIFLNALWGYYKVKQLHKKINHFLLTKYPYYLTSQFIQYNHPRENMAKQKQFIQIFGRFYIENFQMFNIFPSFLNYFEDFNKHLLIFNNLNSVGISLVSFSKLVFKYSLKILKSLTTQWAGNQENTSGLCD